MHRATPAAPEPTVSVVIPVKDDAAALQRCLRALAVQTLPADEIVVVDNGSTDSSAEVATRQGARVVRCDAPGIPAASAAGYDAAIGEVMLRLDADGVPDPRWVERMVEACRRDPRVGAWTGGAHFVDGPPALRRPLAAVYLLAYGLVCGTALGHAPLFGSNLALRRSTWLDVRDRVHRDPGLHDDLDLAFHVGERHRIRWFRGTGMGISMRPFGSGRAFLRRIAAGFRTVLVHWPEDFPPVRWVRLGLRRLFHRLGVPAPGARR